MNNNTFLRLISLIGLCGAMVFMRGSVVFGATENTTITIPQPEASPKVSNSGVITNLTVPRYRYGSPRFGRFVSESLQMGKMGSARNFYEWMDVAYRKSHVKLPGGDDLELGAALRLNERRLDDIPDIMQKADAQVEIAAQVHKLIKAIIPKFSLDRGFEFRNVMKTGERQCFLQSVLIAGLLQSMGVDAGVAMVYKNEQGQETNNGHAVTLVKLPNGRDILVDASEKEPFAQHKGLFVRCADYKYVDPVYENDSPKIRYYVSASENENQATSKVHPLDTAFLDSQFWYYRGERAVGGLLSAKRTKAGLAAAGHALRMGLRFSTNNPLSVYMLGRVYLAQGKSDEAREYIQKGYKLYERFGWIPEGPREYYRRMSAKSGGAH